MAAERLRGRRTASAERLAGLAVFTLALCLGALAAALLSGSFASYSSVKSHLDAFASDGDADLTRTEFDAIVVRLRLAALAAVLGAVAVLLGRRRLSRLLSELVSSAVESIRASRRGLAVAVASESRLHLWTLGVVAVGALLVRLEFLFQPMRYDESVTFVHYASQPWYVALTAYTAPNNHVLHSLAAHVSTSILGGEPWAIRLPALVAGVLLVPATYLATRALYGKHAALVAAALVASSSVLVEYSTNARGYTLLALLFVVLVALAWRLRTSRSLAEWLAFALVAALGFATVPVMLYGYGAVVLWLALELRALGAERAIGRRLLPSVGVTAVSTALFYAPVVATSGFGAIVANEFVEPLSLGTFAARVPDSLHAVAEQWHRDIPLALALVVVAAFLVALAFHRRVGTTALPPALVALAWIVPVVAVQRVVPFERVWTFLVPLYLATAAAGIVFVLGPAARRLGSEVVVVSVVAVTLVGGLGANVVGTQAVYASEDTSTFRDGEAVAALLDERLRAGEKVLVAPPADAILEYHLGRRGLDPAALLYWREPGETTRFLVVVKEGPRDYTLETVLADERLAQTRVGKPRELRRFDGSTVYELAVSRS